MLLTPPPPILMEEKPSLIAPVVPFQNMYCGRLSVVPVALPRPMLAPVVLTLMVSAPVPEIDHG